MTIRGTIAKFLDKLEILGKWFDRLKWIGIMVTIGLGGLNLKQCHESSAKDDVIKEKKDSVKLMKVKCSIKK